MNNIEILESVISEMGFSIIEKKEEESSCIITVRHDIGIFTIYMAKHMEKYVFSLYNTVEHIPFDKIVIPKNSSNNFSKLYIKAIEERNKLISIYSSKFTTEDFRYFLNYSRANV